MICKSELYANTDIDIAIAICTGNSLSISDIDSMSITFTNLVTGSSVTLNSADDEIEITSTTIRAFLLKTHITTPGRQEIKITFTDIGGKTRGITPNPAFLWFY